MTWIFYFLLSVPMLCLVYVGVRRRLGEAFKEEIGRKVKVIEGRRRKRDRVLDWLERGGWRDGGAGRSDA